MHVQKLRNMDHTPGRGNLVLKLRKILELYCHRNFAARALRIS